MINQPKILRERKQSLNKFTESHKENRTRSTSSLPKKIATQPVNNVGSYLLGWGNIPFADDERNFKKLAKNAIKFHCGEKHAIYINHKYEAFGIGESKFGQIGYQQFDQVQKNTVVPILQEFIIQDVFCTPFATFLITNRDDVYACGLNNRGQIGVGNTNQIVTPIKISSLSACRKSLSPKLTKNNKSSKEKLNNKIQSYALAEKTQKLETEGEIEIEQNILHDGEFINYIAGGPYHTVALSNKGRVFYTGNIYKKSAILNDEFTSAFTQLNLKKIGKVCAIRAGITSIGLLNAQGNLFVLGVLNDHIVCDQPYNVGVSCIVDFAFMGNGTIQIVTGSGQVYAANPLKKGIKISRIQSLKDIKQVQCSLDYAIFLDSKNRYYSLGDDNQILLQEHQKYKKVNEPSLMNFGNLFIYSIKCSPTYMVGFCERLPIEEKEKENRQDNEKVSHKKIQQLEKQNKMLKELLKKESQSMRTTIQKQPAPKFDINSKTNLKPRLFDPSLEIPFSEIKLGKQISEGGYGIIYKALWRKTTVAVKIFKVDQNSENSIKDFISQCHAMEALRHPNIVMFLGACTKPPNFAIVLEYCEGGTLWSILQKNADLSWEERRNFALDTAKGMNYLHDRPTPILHRDLKSLNLLLDENKRIKLADFGWTKGLQNYMTGKIGTYQWMAPEVVSSYQYTEKADVFSFAIILWQIASREAPYRNIPGVQVAHDVLHKDMRPHIPKRAPDNFISLMKRCWDKNPDKRPSFAQIINQLETMKLP